MTLLGLLLAMAGLAMMIRGEAGEFAGSAEDEARRVKMRWAGRGTFLLGMLLYMWIRFG